MQGVGLEFGIGWRIRATEGKMAQYMAVISGQRGEASRLGSKVSGITARVNGWGSGVRVEGRFNAERGRDEFTIYLTGGSNGAVQERVLGTFPAPDWDDMSGPVSNK